jgi:hypothetical protein
MTIPYLVLALLAAPTAKQLLDCSIAYHDPQGRWERGAFQITDQSRRPDGTGRPTVLRFDNARNRFEMDGWVDGRALRVVVENDTVLDLRVDGKANLTPEELRSYRLSPPEGILVRRNFYLYLWGLPMKLKDPGTRLDPKVRETNLQGTAVYELRVTYDERVGKDIWYFQLDRETCALVGHRFHHDESAGDGEHAVLSDEVSGQGLRLPRVRKWYKNKGNEFFITHTILSILAPRTR